jgi:hypothetical protein
MLSVIVINPVVNEQRKILTDLRCGETYTGGKFHRREHVIDQFSDVIVNMQHRHGGTVQNGVSRDDNFPNSHALSLMSVA